MSHCHAVRRAVFIEEQNVPPDVEMDDRDATATHILATCDGMAIGAARVVFVDEEVQVNGDGDDIDDDGESGQGTRTTVKVGKIGRVCVLKSHRGRGYGRRIVLFAVDEIRRMVGDGNGNGSNGGNECSFGGVARLGAQVHALKFYESMGFQLIPGKEYMDAGGVPHRDMQLIL